MIKFLIFLFLIYTLFKKIYSVYLKKQSFKNRGDIHSFKVQLADTNNKRTTGLIHVKKRLKNNTGMLFDFKKNLYPKMTMRKTSIDLDCIFINNNGKVVDLISNMKAKSKKSYDSKKLSRYALEVNSGTIKRKNIKVNDYISTTLLKNNITNFKP